MLVSLENGLYTIRLQITLSLHFLFSGASDLLSQAPFLMCDA